MSGDFEGTATSTLRRISPAWYWARKNFSAASLLTIAGIIATSGAYIIHLQTRVVIVERDIKYIKEAVPDGKVVTNLVTRMGEAEERLTRLETNWDDASRVAAAAPHPARRPAKPLNTR